MEEYALMVSTPTLALAQKASPARIALQVGFIILKIFCFRKAIGYNIYGILYRHYRFCIILSKWWME